jgi:acyl carrier protein
MRSKVVGALNLLLATRDDPVEAFLLASSLAAVFPSVGNGSYAAANGYLDGLAGIMRSQNRRVVSVQMGAWADAGMFASNESAKRIWTTQGVKPVCPDLFADALIDLAFCGQTQIIAADIDWDRQVNARGCEVADILMSYGDRNKAVFSETKKSRYGASEHDLSMSVEKEVIRNNLRDIHEADVLCAPNILQIVIEECAGVLGVDHVNANDRFDDIGLDSIAWTELRNRLRTRLDRDVPMSFGLTYATSAMLADALDVGEMPAPPESNTGIGVGQSMKRIDKETEMPNQDHGTSSQEELEAFIEAWVDGR